MVLPMEITKVEVFECHKCGGISKAQEDIIKCLKKHRTQELKEEKEAKFNALSSKLSNYMVENMTSFKKSEVQSHLVAVAKILGLDLTFAKINVSLPKKDYYNKLMISFDASGRLTRGGSSDFDGIDIPKGCPHYLSELIKSKSPSFGDLLRVITGFDVGSGGGGEYFSYEIRLYLDKFPALLEKYNESLDLADKKAHFERRIIELKSQYEKNRVPILYVSDIKYQELFQVSSELSLQIEELNKRLMEVRKNLSDRDGFLRNSDPDRENIITPEEKFNYDSDRLLQLRQELFGV
jgi:tRNA/tmRNA/rRNA uracil-C5-methylase (TrmA/RlmC/RlmD family)